MTHPPILPHTTLISANSLKLAQRENAFNIWRYYLAMVVFCAHYSILTGTTSFNWITSSGEAVAGFFCLSGFMVSMSYLRHPGLKSYSVRRLRRILPPYLLIVLLCAFGGAAISSYTPDAYFSHAGWWRYMAANLSFMNFLGPSLPGVFEQNAITAVNGSLWTLKIELLLYASIPLTFILFHRYRKTTVLIAIFAFSIAYKEIFAALARHSGSAIYTIMERQVGSQFIYFYAGTAILLYFDQLQGRWKWPLIILTLTLYIAGQQLPGYDYIAPFVMALLIILSAYAVRLPALLHKLPNLSYGIYLFHYPVIQTVNSFGLPQRNVTSAFSLSLLITVALAWASWQWVEQPVIKRWRA